MKIKLYYLVGAFFLLSAAPTVFTACSDDDPVLDDEQTEEKVPEEEAKPEKPQRKPETDISQLSPEENKLIHSIYGKASIDPQEITTVHQLAIITSVCASLYVDGPISVTDALLNGDEITLVTLGGTEEVEGQATSMKESQLAAFGKPNDYLTAVTHLFKDGIIPSQKPVVVTGISLGGMIAQQLLGQQDLLATHNLRAIITFGSPLTLPLERQGVKVVRFADVNDQVPELGEMMLRTGLVTPAEMTQKELKQKLDELDGAEKIVRTSKYSEMVETHALSYIEDPCWNDVDFLGDPNRGNVLTLQNTMRFYPAPKLKKE